MKFLASGLVWLALLISHGNSFVVGPSSSQRHHLLITKQSYTGSTALWAGQAQPDVQIKTKTKIETQTKQKVETKRKIKTDDPVARRDEDFQDAPMFILYLLGDESYDPEHVILRMTSIMDDMDEDQAATVFKQAMQQGKAMCGKYPFERAELFKEQLLRSDPMIYADLKEENS